MKANQIFSLDVETLTALRTKAAEVGVSYSALAELFLRGGLATIPLARLQTWALKLRTETTSSPRPRAEQLRKSERIALNVLSSEFQPFELTRAASGQSAAIHWRALQGLLARNLVATLTNEQTLRDPKTGRPLISSWRSTKGETT